MSVTFTELNRPRGRKCKICSSFAPLYGAIDFLSRARKAGHEPEQPSGNIIYYNRCEKCEFIFTSSFDKWSAEDFSAHIYNGEYDLFDQDTTRERLNFVASVLTDLFGGVKRDISILDFGAGHGSLAGFLAENGFSGMMSYDPYFGDCRTIPEQKFDVVLGADVMSQVIDPSRTMETMLSLVKDDGIIMQAMTMPPDDFRYRGLFWWHILPRIGRVSIYSIKSLEHLSSRHGIKFGRIHDRMYIFSGQSKQIPGFWPNDIYPVEWFSPT